MDNKRSGKSWFSRVFDKSKSTRPARRRPTSRSLSFETLEQREMMAGDTIPVTFNIPADVQSQNVYVSIAGQLTAIYNSIPVNAYVYYDNTIHDYVQATSTTTSADLIFQISGSAPVIDLPNTPVQSGQIVMGVGSEFVVTYTADGISTPVPYGPNENKIFGLFEYTVDSDSLDVDMSEVDQVGFPFTITTTDADAPYTEQSVGINQTRTDLFNLYNQYITQQGPTAALFRQSVDAEQLRITAPQNVVEYADQVQVDLNHIQLNNGGSLKPATMYYYWVTATNGYGETQASNVQDIQTDPNTAPIPRKTVQLSWEAFEGAKGYNVYRSETNNLATAQIVGRPTSTTFTDYGTGTATNKVPPYNNYTFYPQNFYFNRVIEQFFTNYTATNSFSIDVTIAIGNNQHKTYTLTGQTNTAYPLEGHTYTVLELTSTDADLANQTFLVFEPFFKENTNNPNLPPAPSWMPHPNQSPGVMIFANDGAFNTGGAQPGVNASVLSNLENSIVSAFNRGIATIPSSKLAPNNWANSPDVTGANVIAGGTLTPDNYFYVVTGTNALGETTASLEFMGQVTGTDGKKTVQLQWKADNFYTNYNIYRSTTPGSGYQLLKTIPNLNPTTQVPSTGFNDDGSYTQNPKITPMMYYAPGSTSNWYAAFMHQNQTINPTTGISVDGLAYAFPYDDQGGNSTNMQGDYSGVAINIQPWGASQTPPVMFDPTPNMPTSIKFLIQPTSSFVGKTTTMRFQAFGPDGQTFIGGSQVKVDVVGAQQGSYLISIDARTGQGTITFKNTVAGMSYLKVTQKNGQAYRSQIFNTLSTGIPESLVSIFNLQSQQLSAINAMYDALDQIARRR